MHIENHDTEIDNSDNDSTIMKHTNNSDYCTPSRTEIKFAHMRSPIPPPLGNNTGKYQQTITRFIQSSI